MESRPRMLLDVVREIIRLKHYSYRTEISYINWIKRYLSFHNRQHPREMGSAEIEAFLSHLAVDQQVAASTQNQALSALLFLYRDVLRLELDIQVNAIRAKPSRYLPTVLTKSEAIAVIRQLSGVYNLTVNVEPTPTRLCTSITPRCNSTNCFTILNPNPVPGILLTLRPR